MKRADALAAIRAAGSANDKQAFYRLYAENRVSLASANAAFREGQRFAQFVLTRDAAREKPQDGRL